MSTNNLYLLPDAPPIPSLRFRPPAGAADAGALLAIHRGRAERDGIDPLSTTERVPTREALAASLAAMSAAGRADWAILAEIDGRPVGFNRVTDWLEADGTHVWLHVGWVLPEWRGRGLGTALLHWSEGRIRVLAGEQGTGVEGGTDGQGEGVKGRKGAAVSGRRSRTSGPSAVAWEYAANASQSETEATALLLDNGYDVAYTVLEMGLDWNDFIPTTARPDGTAIRPGRADHADQIAAAVAEAYLAEYEGGRYGPLFDPAAYAAELREARFDPALWRVAFAGDEVVGQVIPLVERGRAEIYEVSVVPAWRRGGVARALLSAALLDLQARGVAVIRLHTVAEFPTQAHRLYNSLGFRTLKEFPRYRQPAVRRADSWV